MSLLPYPMNVLFFGLLLLGPGVAAQTPYAFEREILLPPLTEETSVWVPLDLHAERQGGAFAIKDGKGNPVPWKGLAERKNLLTEAEILVAPPAAETVNRTGKAALIDGDLLTVFQPATAQQHRFVLRFPDPVRPEFLRFQLASGWIDRIRVRMGSSTSELHDVFAGPPGGAVIRLSGESATILEITIDTPLEPLLIAEAEILASRERMLFRARPGDRYVLQYARGTAILPPPGEVFSDVKTITADLGKVRSLSGGPDTDGDGTPDVLDLCPGIADEQRDRDGDAIGDACDNAPLLPNRAQEDRDRDGIGDAEDNCPDTANPDQKDTDFNGIGWLCDDLDDDGVPNGRDNCVGLRNPDQQDLQNDGIGDACADDRDADGIPRDPDNCSTLFNPDQSDGDGDGIGDACDVCPTHIDPEQIDRDGNGIGDVCQRVQEERERDTDGDGVPDADDLCDRVSNPDQADRDGDGFGDACDNCPAHQNVDQRDRDGNGLGDVCTDTDGDGLLDVQDNCAPYANADQRDRDEDGIGDPCDDDDRDGIENGRDNCPFDSNATQANEDRDAEGDACDRSDDRWSERFPWLLWTSMGGVIVILTLFGGMVLRKQSTRS